MELWEAAKQYLDVPFGHRGRTRKRLDCVGLVILAARDAGLPVTDERVYGREPWMDGMRQRIRAQLGAPVEGPLQVNDVLFMVLHRGAPASHLAIVAPHPAGLGMIHAYGAAKRVKYHILDDVWRSRIAEVYRWPARH